MNREERRKLKKQGMQEESIKNLEILQRPCTIQEVVNLATGVAEDKVMAAIEELRKLLNPTIVSQTIWISTIQKVLVDKGIVTEEELSTIWGELQEEFNKKSEEFITALKEEEKVDASIPKYEFNTSDISIVKEGK